MQRVCVLFVRWTVVKRQLVIGEYDIIIVYTVL